MATEMQKMYKSEPPMGGERAGPVRGNEGTVPRMSGRS